MNKNISRGCQRMVPGSSAVPGDRTRSNDCKLNQKFRLNMRKSFFP